MPSKNISKNISKNSQNQNNSFSPMTPNSIPQNLTLKNLNPTEDQSESKKSSTKPLNFEPSGGLSAFLKVPGILIFCILSGFIIGKLNFSILFLLPIAHISYYIFNRKVTEYKRSLENFSKIQKVQENLGRFETVEWINHILKKFWEVSEQAVSSIVFNQSNNFLSDISKSKPFQLKLAEITLGTRPPIIERISFLQNSENRLVLECACNFIPVQASEEILAYFNEERSHWNTYIEIQVILANLLIIPILVRDFTFSGIFKIEIDLSQKVPFAKKLRFSFLEMPIIDFKLIPLKSVDMLDLPYIGGLLHSVMESQITNMVLEPKSIEIDLEEIAKYSSNVIGVLYIFIHDLEVVDQSTYWINLGNMGKNFAITSKKSGKNPVFNQGFYEIITDKTQNITLTLQSTDQSIHYGKIFLRNLNKFLFSENLHLSNEKSRRFVNITTQFFPISDAFQDNAIIYLNLISVEDLQCIGDPINKLYSTYCNVILENKNGGVVKKMESKRIFTTKDPFYNESFKFFVKGFEDYNIKIEILNEKDNKRMGSVVIACMDVKDKETIKYRICGLESGEMNLKFNIKYISISSKRDNENSDIEDSDKISENNINDNDIKDGVNNRNNTNTDNTISNNTSDTSNTNSSSDDLTVGGYIKHKSKTNIKNQEDNYELESMTFGIYNKKEPNNKFIDFKNALKFTLKSINTSGNFYFVFETDFLNIKSESFSTEFDINKDTVIPLQNEKLIRIRLFRMSLTGDSLVSEEFIIIHNINNEYVVLFEKIRAVFNIEKTEIYDYKNLEDNSTNLKILQIKLGEINRTGDFSIGYYSDSLIQIPRQIKDLSTFLIGRDNVHCKLREKGKTISHVMVPKRNCNEELDFGNGIKAKIECKIQECNFKKENTAKSGELEIFIIKANNLKSIKNEIFVKIFMNNEKIHKTNKKAKNSNPIFNESFRIKVHKNLDEIGFQIYSCSSLTVDDLVYFCNIPLFNISEGYSKYDLKLKRPNNENNEDETLQVIFNYKGEFKNTMAVL